MQKKKKASKLDLKNALRKNLRKRKLFKKNKYKIMILNDKQIKRLAEEQEMISPFVGESISRGISHGLNSFGYDLKLWVRIQNFYKYKRSYC